MGNSSSQPATTESVGKDIKKGVDKTVKTTNNALHKTSDKVTKTGKEAEKAVNDAAKSLKKEGDRLSKNDRAAAVPVLILIVAAGYYHWKRSRENKGDSSATA